MAAQLALAAGLCLQAVVTAEASPNRQLRMLLKTDGDDVELGRLEKTSPYLRLEEMATKVVIPNPTEAEVLESLMGKMVRVIVLVKAGDVEMAYWAT